MVGLTTASTVLLRNWKKNVTSNLREQLGTLTGTTSDEDLFQRLKSKKEDGVSSL